MLLLDCLMMRHDAAAPREYAPSRVARRCLLALERDGLCAQVELIEAELVVVVVLLALLMLTDLAASHAERAHHRRRTGRR